ncbi:hypothetical protein PYW07_006782 [Mythimna separata]|uniref:DUF4817 domain-containing protein n=1 Tax=Mythimna separata TaxID=271217 RepID=A0AAD7YU96_MYTSE|nr:hypothetical protein PYW07_006782 [Mythimna separata]
MYQFQNHEIYHPNPYQHHCQLFAENSKNQSLAVTQNNYFEVLPAPRHVVSSQPHEVEALPASQTLTPADEKKTLVTNKSSVDTSTFSIEERLVAAVWVHERKHSKNSMSQIKNDFRQRFGREPPAKNTLLAWERKLFSTGSVHDAPRPGRPVNRVARMEEVAASVRAAPALSLRARSLQLRLPRTTLRTILRRDLARPARPKPTPHHAAAGKQQIKGNVKRHRRRKSEPGACAPAPHA